MQPVRELFADARQALQQLLGLGLALEPVEQREVTGFDEFCDGCGETFAHAFDRAQRSHAAGADSVGGASAPNSRK